jgi:hypothetical protein
MINITINIQLIIYYIYYLRVIISINNLIYILKTFFTLLYIRIYISFKYFTYYTIVIYRIKNSIPQDLNSHCLWLVLSDCSNRGT